MFDRVITVAQQTWKELRYRNAYLMLMMTFVLCYLMTILVGVKISSMLARSDSSLSNIVFASRLTIFVGTICSFIFSAGIFAYEVSRRTILAVLIRPIHRYEYMCGRVLGVVFFFSIFVVLVTVFSFIASVILDVSLPSSYYVGILLRYFSGICFILIFASLGLFLSSTQVIVSMIFCYVISRLFLNTPADLSTILDFMRMFFHYLLPLEVDVDMSQGGWMDKMSLYHVVLTMVENLLYGMACFTIALFYLEKQDIKLKEE